MNLLNLFIWPRGVSADFSKTYRGGLGVRKIEVTWLSWATTNQELKKSNVYIKRAIYVRYVQKLAVIFMFNNY